MFHFWSGKGDPPRPSASPKAAPKTASQRVRMVDVQGMIQQASNKVGVKELLKKGKKDITLLSRERIEELINRSVVAAVEKQRAAGDHPGDRVIAQMQAESRAHFNNLLQKATEAAKSTADPTQAILRLIRNCAMERPALPVGPAEPAGENDRRIFSFNAIDAEAGRGLDVGTVNICAGAKAPGVGGMVFNLQRNAFLELRDDALTRKLLPRFGIDYVIRGERTYIVGDAAFNLANLFEKTTRRPMRHGLLSPDEPEALLIVNQIVTELLGHPRRNGEVCVYSVPGDSVEGERSFIYHRAALESIIRNLGYTPRPMMESHLLVFAELKEQDYTGLGISCGGGMFNICLSYKGVPALAFSTSRGGDWIDASVSEAVGLPPSQICGIKEGGMDLLHPKGRVEEAIAIYYRHLLHYTMEQMRNKIVESDRLPTFDKPLEVVLAGGTSMVRGFTELFRQELDSSNFPIRLGQLRAASDPLKAVVKGCVQAALEETKAPGAASVQIAPAALERAAVRGVPKIDDGARSRLAAFAGPSSANGENGIPRARPA